MLYECSVGNYTEIFRWKSKSISQSNDIFKNSRFAWENFSWHAQIQIWNIHQNFSAKRAESVAESSKKNRKIISLP